MEFFCTYVRTTKLRPSVVIKKMTNKNLNLIQTDVISGTFFSQPVGTTAVESRNVYWVFGFRRVHRALKLDPHSFNAGSKRDLTRF
jgi:hypothetical protein